MVGLPTPWQLMETIIAEFANLLCFARNGLRS
jgi:hypothetical protein